MTEPQEQDTEEYEYYDCCESETLVHETIEDAVADYLDRYMSPNCDVSKVIEECGEIEVGCYRRNKVTDRWLNSTATAALDLVCERFSEEYGGPDDSDVAPDEEAMRASLPAMVDVVRSFVAHGHVWSCDLVKMLTFSPEEVEAMMRKERPYWWDDEPTAPPSSPAQ